MKEAYILQLVQTKSRRWPSNHYPHESIQSGSNGQKPALYSTACFKAASRSRATDGPAAARSVFDDVPEQIPPEVEDMMPPPFRQQQD